jgi:hypothetical protein
MRYPWKPQGTLHYAESYKQIWYRVQQAQGILPLAEFLLVSLPAKPVYFRESSLFWRARAIARETKLSAQW